MTDEGRDQPAGVYYAQKDYAGLGRRLFVLAIDGLVVYVGYLATWVVFGWVRPGDAVSYTWVISFAAFCYLYLAVLARSRFGTLGYTLASVQVLDLSGRRPSLACMSFRTLFAVLGPLNALLDVIWLGGDPHRQALRDKLAGTYVVRRGAVPGGEGPQRHVLVWFLTYSFVVREVGKRGT
jgi:uncharacterized RDD family membrane protein YckC